ncbi:MAG: coproporphyrinogen-III oxidase family protein [Lentisphaeria bacterium]|nr:coproporphyrinogen-III oxidase family protein [Lentisphaeria bacterium]
MRICTVLFSRHPEIRSQLLLLVNLAEKDRSCTDAREAPEPLAGNYFVSAYPPFSCWQEDVVPEFEARLDRPFPEARNGAMGLYVHIPFCVMRCLFCYYLSYVRRTPEQIDSYIDALIRELSLYRQRRLLTDREFEFIYFGGGTPSILSLEQWQRLCDGLQSVFSWRAAREVTFECAPQSVSEDKLRALRDAGVTRISMGIQQLDDEVLEANGRVHLVRDVENAFAIIEDLGFDVVNVDLIVGMIGESDRSFVSSLERVIGMNVPSVTIYQLEIPLNTPLFRLHRQGRLQAPDDWHVKRARLARGFEMLEAAGYHVRSGYTAVRDPERHQFVYQDAQYHGADLLGIGVSSFSYLGGIHCQNVTSLDEYHERLAAGRLPAGRAYVLNVREQLTREFILQLKLGSVDCEALRGKFDIDAIDHFARPLEQLAAAGYLQRRDNEVVLTRQGLLRVDRLLPEFYAPEHQDLRYS